jgi:hypothetical protein
MSQGTETPVLFPQMQIHLGEIIQEPETELNTVLFDHFIYQLTGLYPLEYNFVFQITDISCADHNTRPIIPLLLPTALHALQVTQHEPTPLARVISALLAPLSLEEALTFATPEGIFTALSSPIGSVNNLALNIIGKAQHRPTDAAIVASMPDVVGGLVELWLTSHDIDVAAKAGKLIVALCTVDVDLMVGASLDPPNLMGHSMPVQHGEHVGTYGQGLMWRRLFQHKDTYELFFKICSNNSNDYCSPATSTELTHNQRTLAQARLLEVLPMLAALNFDILCSSNLSDVGEAYGLPPSRRSLMDFATVYMVDITDDSLHMTLINFFCALLEKSVKPGFSGATGFLSPKTALDFLISRLVHIRTMKYYLEPQAIMGRPNQQVAQMLYGYSATYIATYIRTNPEHVLKDTQPGSNSSSLVVNTIDVIIGRIASNLSRGSTDPPMYDLALLKALPRVVLLPGARNRNPQAASWAASPVSTIPFTYEPAYLDILALLFAGPELQWIKDPNFITFPPTLPNALRSAPSPALDPTEASAARALFALYAHEHPEFFDRLLQWGSTVAITESAIAANELLRSLIGVRWEHLPDAPQFVDLSKDGVPDLQMPITAISQQNLSQITNVPVPHVMHYQEIPSTGLALILSRPIVQMVLPYLLGPAQTFANLVGGRGDTESAAYRVAVSRFQCVEYLHMGLSQCTNQELELLGVPIAEIPYIRKQVAERVQKGAMWAGDGAGPGTNIAALGM